MPRGRKAKTETVDSQWKSGTFNPLKPGTVCRSKGSDSMKPLFVIGSQNYHVGTYNAKAWHGPQPWDYTDTEVHYSQMEVVDIPNPTKYDMADRYPGPSSEQIRELKKKFAETARKQAEEMTQADREAALAAMEEELGKKRIMDDGSPTDAGMDIDPLEKKRQEMIDEE